MFFESIQVFSSPIPIGKSAPEKITAGFGSEMDMTFALLLNSSINDHENEGVYMPEGLPVVPMFQPYSMRLTGNRDAVEEVHPVDIESISKNRDIHWIKTDLEIAGSDGKQIILPVKVFMFNSGGQPDDSLKTVMIVIESETFKAIVSENVSALSEFSGGAIVIASNETAENDTSLNLSAISLKQKDIPETFGEISVTDAQGNMLRIYGGREQSATFISGESSPRIVICPDISTITQNAQSQAEQVSGQDMSTLIGKLVPKGESVKVVYVISDAGEQMTGISSGSEGLGQNLPETSNISIENGIMINRILQWVSDTEQKRIQTPAETAGLNGESSFSAYSANSDIIASHVENIESVEIIPEQSDTAVESVIHNDWNQTKATSDNLGKPISRDRQSIPLTDGADKNHTPSVSVPETGNIGSSRSENTDHSETQYRFAETESQVKMPSAESKASSGENVTGRTTATYIETNIENTPDVEKTSVSTKQASRNIVIQKSTDSDAINTMKYAESNGNNDGKEKIQTTVDSAGSPVTVEHADVVNEGGNTAHIIEMKGVVGGAQKTQPSEKPVFEQKTVVATQQNPDAVLTAVDSSEWNHQASDFPNAQEIIFETAKHTSAGEWKDGNTDSATKTTRLSSEELPLPRPEDIQINTESGNMPRYTMNDSQEIKTTVAGAKNFTASISAGEISPDVANQINSSSDTISVAESVKETQQFIEQEANALSGDRDQEPIKSMTFQSTDKQAGSKITVQSYNTISGQGGNEILSDNTVLVSGEHYKTAGLKQTAEKSSNENNPENIPAVTVQDAAEGSGGNAGTQGDRSGFPFGSWDKDQFADLMKTADDPISADIPDTNTDNSGRGFAVLDPVDTHKNALSGGREIMSAKEPFGMDVVDDGQLVETIVRGAVIMTRNGRSSAVINLEPPSLGKIHLEIATERSTVTGRITVESVEIKNLVQNNLAELREHLAQNGLKVESFDVQVGHNDGTDSWARNETFRMAEKHGNQAGLIKRDSYNTSSAMTMRDNKSVLSRSPFSQSIDMMI